VLLAVGFKFTFLLLEICKELGNIFLFFLHFLLNLGDLLLELLDFLSQFADLVLIATLDQFYLLVEDILAIREDDTASHFEIVSALHELSFVLLLVFDSLEGELFFVFVLQFMT
jgi:hypothetical protein